MTERQAFGIDINEYSRTGGIHYLLAKAHILAGNYDFLIIKAGLGYYMSPLWPEQKQNTEAEEIPYATYHFLDPRCNMREQMHRYIDWVGTQQPFYILDIESPQAGVRVPSKDEILASIDEIEKLTHKQPVLYSSYLILKQIGFLQEASRYPLWIAQYPYDATRLSQKVQYRYIHDFKVGHADRPPSSVVGTELENSTILWQFSSCGDGQFYIYNPETKDPTYPVGMKNADMNVSIKSCSEFMQEMFGVSKGGGGGIVHPKDESPYPGMTNQMMVNLIFAAAAPFTQDPWNDWIVRAGLESLAVPNANRNKRYTGPRIEDLPNLTEQEKAAILAEM